VESRTATNVHPARILVEVEERRASGDLAPRTTYPEDFGNRASEIADGIAEIAQHMRSRLGQLLETRTSDSWKTESIEIGFDLAVQAEAGILIAKASAGTTFSARVLFQPSGESK
jgi:NCAIR mutase (PurE)-related protein